MVGLNLKKNLELSWMGVNNFKTQTRFCNSFFKHQRRWQNNFKNKLFPLQGQWRRKFIGSKKLGQFVRI